MFLKRREFLLESAALAVAHSADFRRPETLSGAKMIWSATSVPVPIQSGGQAAGIASSSHGAPNDSTADLHSVFAKEIVLNTAPTRAQLHLFAFTRYRLYVNGSHAGRGPCRYQNQRPEYDTREIGGWLRAGRNVVVVLVHRDAPTGRIMRHDPGLVASLDLEQGGKRQTIGTDASWLSMPEMSFGPRTHAWASIEEHLDARKTGDWTRPNLAPPLWQPSVVVPGGEEIIVYPRSSPLQTETERSWSAGAPAFPIDLSAGGGVSLTLPEIAQAFPILEMDAEEDSLLEIDYTLPQGEHSGKCTYIARSGPQTYIGGDTFVFRRLQLTLKSGRIRLTRAAAYEVRYPFQRAASFSCSDPFLTRLWSICARSLEVLSEDAYIDCADRERVEWTDDSPPAFDCTRTMMRGPDEGGRARWGDARLLRGLLRRISLTQQPDGQLKAHSCSERFDIHAIMEDRSCDWVVLLREYLESTGDRDLVRELWPTLATLLDWYRKRRTGRGLILAREWEAWDNPLRYQVCEGAGLNAMVYRALTDASALADSIGKAKDAKLLAQEAARLQVDYDRLLWDEQEGAYDGGLFGPGSEIRSQLGRKFTGTIVDGRFRPTAQANLFALYGGIAPPARRALVRNWILKHLEEVREPMSHYYLFRMMYAMEDEQQDREVLRLMKAGWQNQVDSEWQTSWEELEQSGASKIHVYGMHPGYFLTAYVLGGRREGPVDRRTLVIEPRFSGLDWAKGVGVTEFGPVEMDWKRDGAGVEIRCTVPAFVKGMLRLRSQREASVLQIDGSAAAPQRANGWMETVLHPGKHVIQLR